MPSPLSIAAWRRAGVPAACRQVPPSSAAAPPRPPHRSGRPRARRDRPARTSRSAPQAQTIDLDPVPLHVGPGGQEQPARRHRAGFPALAPVVEPLPVRRFAGSDPSLAEDRVAECLDAPSSDPAPLPRPHDPLPTQPADRRIERREVEADRVRIGGNGRRPPFAAGQHRRLVVLADGRVAALADDIAPFPACPSASAAGRTSAIASRRNAGTARRTAAGRTPRIPARSGSAPDGGRRDQEHLAPCAKVSDRASASVTGSPSSSAIAG